MKPISIPCYFTVFSADELSHADRELLSAAQQAADSSYAPYSHFNVGAALRLEDGTVILGSNQENASYGATQCAERNAMHHAACYHPDTAPVALAVAARGTSGWLPVPIPPCGICRQAILETETRYGRRMRILLYGTQGTWVCEGVQNLLPLQFTGDTMKL